MRTIPQPLTFDWLIWGWNRIWSHRPSLESLANDSYVGCVMSAVPLDGGHLLYYLIELVKGSPVSEQAQVAGQYFGLIALAGLMSLAFVNDILRLVG